VLLSVSGTWTDGQVLMLIRAWFVNSYLWFSPDLEKRNFSVTSVIRRNFVCERTNLLVSSDIVMEIS